MNGFHLSKWYLDCVSDEGTALVGYWARLRWGSLALDYAALLAAPAGAEPSQFHTLRSPPPPALSGSQCTWQCEPLHVEGHWITDAPPVQMDLLDSPADGVRWSIHQPRADARIRFRETGRPGAAIHEIRGMGYVETLELTLPPWRLPFNTLRWGRFLSPEHALVWLEWQKGGSHPGAPALGESRRCFAVLDNVLVAEPEITDQTVLLPDLPADLRFHSPRPLREGPLVATVFGAIPGLTGLLPGTFRRAHESKRLSQADLHLPGQVPARGWSIYEVVTW